MGLPAGTRLGQYDILASIGAGGMGEVYKARDTRLGRAVALKTLPHSFSEDAERLARFEREAHILAALNHPHIAAIHGFEHVDGHRFLVLELVDGGTLADRIQDGPIQVDNALDIAHGIALALEAAHEKGIVHRDLKPSNIAFAADGRVKVLDFGLARATPDGQAFRDANPDHSPTITSPVTLTGLGVILGTVAYMSPEQARGAVADTRSDVWAFGCVLYEMLTGVRAFQGTDVSDTLASILRSSPDWTRLPGTVPTAIRSLLTACLEKDPRRRVRDISTARFVLEQRSSLDAQAPVPRRVPPVYRVALLALAVVSLLLGAATLMLWRRPETPPPPVTRFSITLPEGLELTLARRPFTVSPDGTRIVFGAGGRLFVRHVGTFASKPIPGSETAVAPTFSPDGRSLVYWTALPALRRIDEAGGVPITIATTSPAPFGLTWTERGIIYMEPGKGVLHVSPDSSTPTRWIAIPGTEGMAHGPELLPDGDTLLYALGTSRTPSPMFWDDTQIVAHSITSGQRKVLVPRGNSPTYLPTGHLLYALEGTLLAVPFDARRLEVTGGPVPVVEGVRRAATAGGGQAYYSVSRNGTLVYVSGPARAGFEDVFLYDGRAIPQPLNLPLGSYAYPRVSRDGSRLAVQTAHGTETSIAIYDLSGKASLRRLTFGGNSRFPVWTRDGRRVVFQSDREGDNGIFWQSVEGGPAQRLTTPEPGTSHLPEAWSPVEDLLLYSVARGEDHELWSLSTRDRKAGRVGSIRSTSVPTTADFSPDGRWVAYQAGLAGEGEATTFVEPFPPTGAKHQIGRGGRAVWSRDGSKLYFVPGPAQLESVTITTTPTFSFTPAVSVPRRFGLAPPGTVRTFDLLRDGRIVGVNAAGEAGASSAAQIHVVQNWFDELRARVPAMR
jgi:serine/threonine-protein kinase